MAKVNVKTEYREIVKLFNELTGSKSMWQVFNDCVEVFALAFQNQFEFGKKREENEERYQQIVKSYTEKEFEVILRIFAKLVDMAEENPFRDLLGDLYMQLEMGSSALGQFFTPYHVSYAMAKSMRIEDVKSTIENQGYITVNEPACGGGATVIAFCEFLYKNDINYQKECVIVCQDLSRLTAMMCYVVLSILGCSAVVKCADTLRDPYTNWENERRKGSEIWTTPMFHVNNCYKKC